MFGKKPSSPPTYHERTEAVRRALATLKSEYQISDAEMMQTLTQIADDIRRQSAYAPIRELQVFTGNIPDPGPTLAQRIGRLMKRGEPVDDGLAALIREQR